MIAWMQVHAFCVCDDPEYFYDYTQGLLDGLQAGVRSRDIVNVENVSTLVMSTAENDLFIEDFLLNLLSVAVDIM